MKFLLEDWQEKFIPHIAEYANNKKIADNLTDAFPHPYTEEDAKIFIKDCIGKRGKNQLNKAITVDGKAVGSIGVFQKEDIHRKTAEMGYWLAEPYWGKGIMPRAVRQICEEAFQVLDIVRIYAEPISFNAASRKVLEKAGLTLESVQKNNVYKNGKIYDSCIYTLLKK